MTKMVQAQGNNIYSSFSHHILAVCEIFRAYRYIASDLMLVSGSLTELTQE